jgi:hypothetical protein
MIQRFICGDESMHPMLYRENRVLGDRHSHACTCNPRLPDSRFVEAVATDVAFYT